MNDPVAIALLSGVSAVYGVVWAWNLARRFV